MATRREAREWAVQILFQLDANPVGQDGVQKVFDEFWANQLRIKMEASDEVPDELTFTGAWRDLIAEKKIRQFAEQIVVGVRDNLTAINEILRRYAEHWDIGRMGGIERNSIRMGIYELMFQQEKVPVAVVINEAIDVCKFFGMRESGRFVNGILDNIAKHELKDEPEKSARKKPLEEKGK